MRELTLYAPDSFWAAPPELRAEIVNGCGPGHWKYDLVADTIYGMSVADVCDIHDWMYARGKTIADKEEADRVMLNNALRKIEWTRKRGRRWMQWPRNFLAGLRRRRALKYYEAVLHFGGPAFWGGKNNGKERRLTDAPRVKAEAAVIAENQKEEELAI